MQLKGLREIATHDSIANRAMPRTRQAAAFELARLEHEKARLEREIGMWCANQKKAEARLKWSRERCALATRMLQESGTAAPRKRTARRPKRAWKSVTLEY